MAVGAGLGMGVGAGAGLGMGVGVGAGLGMVGWLVGGVSFGTPVRCTAPFPVVSAALCTYSYLLLLLTSFTCFFHVLRFCTLFFPPFCIMISDFTLSIPHTPYPIPRTPHPITRTPHPTPHTPYPFASNQQTQQPTGINFSEVP